MCGRFVQHRPPLVYAEFYGISTEDAPLPNAPARYNAAPTQELMVVRRHPETGRRVLSQLRWGLVPVWSQDASDGARLINARSESIADKRSFRAAWLKKRRCIVPADGFYEWQRRDGGKQPYYISPKSDEPLSFAGLWEGWKDPATGLWLRTFTILTCPANAELAPLHERMPVILPRDAIASYLTADDPRELLRPAPAATLVTWPVSQAVNAIRNDGPELIRPLSL